MDGRKPLLWLLLLLGLFGLSGASCPNMVRRYTAPLPRVLPPSPTLEQVIQVVNRNNSQISSLWSSNARLSAPGMPTLRASLAFQQPRYFRLRADTAVSGPELDLGSNDELFWFWIRRSQPPAVYYCRHDQYATAPARYMVPIPPDLLLEALGTTQFDPSLPYEGPYVLPGDRLEVRSIRNTPEGPHTKSTVIDASQGWVLEQHLYDAQGRLIASSMAGGHRRDPLTNLVVPTTVTINCPPAQFTMRIDLGNVRVNRLAGNPEELWTMPQYQGSQVVNLCDPNWLRYGRAPLLSPQ